MPQNTQAFFDKYAKAYRAYDANAVAELYFIPAVIMSDDNKDVFSSTQDVVMYVERLMVRLRKIGAVDFVPHVCQTMRLSDNILFSNVKWSFYAEGKKPLFSCYVSYTLQFVENDLKVIVTVMDDEERELAKLL